MLRDGEKIVGILLKKEQMWNRSSGKLFQHLKAYRVGSCVLEKGAMTVEPFASTSDQHFFNQYFFFCLMDKTRI